MRNIRNSEWSFPIVTLVAVIVVAGGVFLAIKPNAPATLNPVKNTSHVAKTTSDGGGIVDPGSSLDGRPAPKFTLTDQFGNKVSLSQFKGKIVVLAFVDSECTTICPLTTESMMRALKMLGPQAAKHVELLGIDANPKAISVSDVRKYSKEHNMLNSWHFLTGSLSQLKTMWKHYYIYDQIVNGQIDHTPALYIIGPRGKEQYLFMTPQQYAAVDAQASVVAHQVAKFLPSSVKPALQSVAYHAPKVSPSSKTTIPLANGGGTVTVGPGKPQLLAFFASWVPNISTHLKSLDKYAGTTGAPEVLGIDVATTEPGNNLNSTWLKKVSPANYRTAIDKTGELADAYGVTDLMWLELTDGKGHVIWKHDGWLPIPKLSAAVQSKLPGVKTN